MHIEELMDYASIVQKNGLVDTNVPLQYNCMQCRRYGSCFKMVKRRILFLSILMPMHIVT
jgi:hypothetical protein